MSIAAAPASTHAHGGPDASEASVALSALPVASVVTASAVGGASVGGAAVAISAVPAALAISGATLVVVAVEVTASGVVYVLERASDGARVSVQVASHGAGHVALSVGSAVETTVISAGVVLSAAGEVLAYVPNRLGEALLHNERLTR
ncbi:hypothetical protein [Hydrogenophaga sp. 5NK40-0174]|uniref:hypothetical protein n=1 Tax=Hydrogenophaga sp. 5NK40-0174 TaxID=3127649 RepID=UPI00334236A8